MSRVRTPRHSRPHCCLEREREREGWEGELCISIFELIYNRRDGQEKRFEWWREGWGGAAGLMEGENTIRELILLYKYQPRGEKSGLKLIPD